MNAKNPFWLDIEAEAAEAKRALRGAPPDRRLAVEIDEAEEAEAEPKADPLAPLVAALDAERKAYQARTADLIRRMQALEAAAMAMLPPPPERDLAETDPAAYLQARAMRDNAERGFEALLNAFEENRAEVAKYVEVDAAKAREDEGRRLLDAMPELTDAARKAEFDEAVRKTAMEFGFDPTEVHDVCDHRILRLVHYAALGRRAEANRDAARRQVQPPAEGRLGHARQTPKRQRQQAALAQFYKTGAIEDAMRVDFD